MFDLVVGCGDMEFTCGNGDCIPLSLVLDNVRDCVDGTDEILSPEEAATLPSAYSKHL